jgi:DNA-binding LacI/PurR family transcriptional regulator
LKRSTDSIETALGVRPQLNPTEVVLKSETSNATVEPQPATTKQASVREVARLAKVSPATVSLVINENPRISVATQKRVRRAMEQLRYRPNRLAQNLSGRYTKMLAIMLPSLSHAFADQYFGELISGICDHATSLDYKVMLEQATPNFIKHRRHLELFERRFVDGVLCLGNGDRHPFLNDFAAAKHPMIVVNNYFPQWNLDCVVCDYRDATEQAMNYLFQLGHQRIGIITGSSRVQTARDVVDTYDKKLRESVIDPLPTWREDGLYTEEGGSEAARKLVARHPDLTAILAGNDKMAIGAIHYLNEFEKRVPTEISVIGMDDMRDAAFANPALTTIHMPLYQVGVLSCEKLIGRIQGDVDPIRAVLTTHLKVRNSTAIARDSLAAPSAQPAQ